MPFARKHQESSEQADEVVFDDGGSGLYDACVGKFAPHGLTVRCDSRHTVWVEDGVSTFSMGLAPWILRLRSMDEVLDDVEAKMKAARARTMA